MMRKGFVHICFLALVLALPYVTTGCGNFDQNYTPASIEFISPGNATVYAPGTESVVITGRVIPGETVDDDGLVVEVPVEKLYVGNSILGENLAFDETTGEFSYTFTLDQDKVHSTCTFEVLDAEGISNLERISFTMGTTVRAGDPGVVDDAIGALLTQDIMDTLAIVIARVINTVKYDLVYGYDDPVYGSGTPDPLLGNTKLLPLDVPVDGLGSIVIDNDNNVGGNKQGFINFGKVSLGVDLQNGNNIGATLTMAPESGVNPRGGESAIFVQGYHDWWLTGFPHFTVYAAAVNVTNLKIQLHINSENKICAKLDFSNCSIDIPRANVEYGILSIPSWLMGIVIDVVEFVLKHIPIDIPIMDAGSLGADIMGMHLGVWPMNANPIFTSTNDQMKIDLGIAMSLVDWSAALNPGVDRFISTPGDAMPDYALTGDENVLVAVSDDFVNQAAFILVQSGMLMNLDITEKLKKDMPDLALYNEDLKVTVQINTPPVADFNEEAIISEDFQKFGRFKIANLVLNIKSLKLTPFSSPMDARVGVDADAVVNLVLSEDMRKLEARADFTLSDVDLKLLYCTDINAGVGDAFVSTIKSVAQMLINDTLSLTMDQDIPAIDLYGASPKVEFVGNDFENNYIIARLILGFDI
ncbi:MAG: hypothetical protein CVV44_06545 [Spirochaetae bacterium HGW-Spirochaetae-1]|jgi:hypothetical protein|nr:MAG: hypothetical protein CVV44_06545 [Spirochaetae bacterium HGW-Spirochaetae-1]